MNKQKKIKALKEVPLGKTSKMYIVVNLAGTTKYEYILFGGVLHYVTDEELSYSDLNRIAGQYLKKDHVVSRIPTVIDIYDMTILDYLNHVQMVVGQNSIRYDRVELQEHKRNSLLAKLLPDIDLGIITGYSENWNCYIC